MPVTFYLCEKPSQARAIAEHLGITGKSGLFIETRSGVIGHARGHLVESQPPEFYNPAFKQWCMGDLPIVPALFQVQPCTDTLNLFDAIGQHLRKATKVVIATDADREGEMIARELLDFHGYKGAISRLWLSAFDAESITKALANLKTDDATRPLYHAALARSRADWLIGMNMSRALTLVARKPGEKGVLSVGRVQTPTLALVVRRDKSIKNFKPTDYFEILADLQTSDGQNVSLRYAPTDEERLSSRQQAKSIAEAVEGSKGPLRVTKDTKKQSPPKLFSLSGFQIQASAKHGWSAEHSLSVLQSLYDPPLKLTTYPRSDCEFLPSEQAADVPRILDMLQGLKPLADIAIESPVIRNTVFNSAKVTAHHAIIPTGERPASNALTEDQRTAYMMIARRYLAALMPDYVYEQTKLTYQAADVEFSAIGRVPQVQGWKLADGDPDQDENGNPGTAVLPAIKDGSLATCTSAEVEAKKTKAPAHYTEGTLIGDMKAIGKFVEDPEKKKKLRETSGIGTEATRASIVARLRTAGFLETKGKKILSTERGQYLIESLESHLPILADAGETAVWEEELERIAEGKAACETFTSSIASRLSEYVTTLAKTNPVASERQPSQSPRTALAQTYKKQAIYDCGDYWSFEAVKGFFRKVLSGRAMTLDEYLSVLQQKKDADPKVYDGFTSKSGKLFCAALRYNAKKKHEGNPAPGIEFIFLN